MPVDLKKIAAEIILKANTESGARQAARDFEKVAESAEGAARVTEKTEKNTASVERAYGRLERRLDPLATAHKKLQQNLETLNRAQAFGNVTAERAAELQKRLRADYQQTADRIRRQEQAQKELNRETGKFSIVANAAKGAVVGFFAAFSFREVIRGARESVSALDEIAKKARSLGGIGQADFLQTARFALSQQGVSDADKLLEQFNRRLGQLSFGKGEGVELLRRVEGGEALKQQVLGAKSLEDAYETVIAKIGEVENASQRAALAGAFFGEELAGKLGNAFEQGVDGFNELQQRARDLGLVIDDDVLVKAEQINDDFDTASRIIGVQLKQAFVAIAPIVLKIAEASAEFTKNFGDFVDNTFDPRARLERQLTLALGEQERARKNLERARNGEFGIPQIAIARAEKYLQKTTEAVGEVNGKLAQFEALSVTSTKPLLDALGIAVGLTGDLGDGFDDNTEAIKRAAAEAERLRDAFYKLEGDSISRLEQLEILAEASTIGPEALAAAQDRLEIEAKIAQLRVAAAAAGLEFDEEAARIREQRIIDLQDQISTNSRPVANAERQFAEGYGRELDRVADDFIDRLARGDRSAFKGLATQLRDILFDEVLDPFKQAFANLLRGIFSGEGFGGSVNSPFLEGIDQFFRQRGVDIGELGQAAAGGFAGYGIGSGVADYINGERGETGSRVGGAVGGGIGFAVGGPVGAFVGSAIGSFFGDVFGSLFGGKPSDFAAGGGVNFSTFSAENQFARGTQNIEARDEILQATSELARTLTRLTGGTLAGSGISVQVGSRNGTRIISGAGGDVTTPVGDAQAALEEIVRQLTVSLRGGDDAIREAAVAFAAAKFPVDDIVARLETLKSVLASTDEPVDAFAERLEALRGAFDGLDITTGKLAAAFEDAVDKLAGRLNEDNQKALTEFLNPALAQVQALIKAQDARDAAARDIAGSGGNVDFTLLARVNREAILSLFNIEDRLGQARDPVAFSIEEFRKTQAQELAALTAAVDGVRIFSSDVEALLRTQAAERVAFFNSIPEEDRLRLAGLADDFQDIGGRYALTLTRINEEFQRQLDNFDETRRELEDRIAARTQSIDDYERAIADLDRFGGQSTPGQSLEKLRGDVEQLFDRSLQGDDFARERLPQAVQDFIERSRQINASTGAFTNDFNFARGILDRVREQLVTEKSTAERQLDSLLTQQDLLEQIRDLLASPTLDPAAFATLANRLDPSNPLYALSQQLLDLNRQQFDISQATLSALEALDPASVGIYAPANDDFAALSASVTPLAPSPSTQSGGSVNEDAATQDLIDGVYVVASRLDEIKTLMETQGDDQKKRDDQARGLIAQLVGLKAVNL